MSDRFKHGVPTIVTEIGEIGNYYVILDIDTLDPSITPVTLGFHQAKKSLHGISRNSKFVGVDIV